MWFGAPGGVDWIFLVRHATNPFRDRRRTPGMKSVIAAVLLATTPLAGCSSEDTPSADPAKPSEANMVTIERSRFEPTELTVAVGATVVFENIDPFAHTVTSTEESPVCVRLGRVP